MCLDIEKPVAPATLEQQLLATVHTEHQEKLGAIAANAKRIAECEIVARRLQATGLLTTDAKPQGAVLGRAMWLRVLVRAESLARVRAALHAADLRIVREVVDDVFEEITVDLAGFSFPLVIAHLSDASYRAGTPS